MSRPQHAQVFVLTAMVLVDMLNHGFIGLERASLLVFDECHHILAGANTGRHPYAQIMEVYNAQPADKPRPKILGLTASLINNDVRIETLPQCLDMLERALDACICTASDLANASKYGAKPNKALIECDSFRPYDDPVLRSVS